MHAEINIFATTNIFTRGHPQTLYLNEAGLYDLMMRSKMPKARKFSRWVELENASFQFNLPV